MWYFSEDIMESVITRLSVCPIRSHPDDASEMVSQLLFGERAEVLERKKPSWIRIRCLHDGYEGWMDQKQLEPYKEEDKPRALCIDTLEPVFCDDESTFATMGAELPGYDGMTATVNGWTYRFSGQALFGLNGMDAADLAERLARKLLNVPYLWGGRSPLGLDCSGLTQVVYKCCGIALPRDSKDQAGIGEVVDFFEQSQTGDLAFFSKESGKITHVGIILGEKKIIHASGKVRIDSIDHYGIFNRDIEEYTHRLKIIKRVI